MKQCLKCSKEINDDANFCNFCGEEQNTESPKNSTNEQKSENNLIRYLIKIKQIVIKVFLITLKYIALFFKKLFKTITFLFGGIILLIIAILLFFSLFNKYQTYQINKLSMDSSKMELISKKILSSPNPLKIYLNKRTIKDEYKFLSYRDAEYLFNKKIMLIEKNKNSVYYYYNNDDYLEGILYCPNNETFFEGITLVQRLNRVPYFRFTSEKYFHKEYSLFKKLNGIFDNEKTKTIAEKIEIITKVIKNLF